eukprot:TRINITY_DN43429_c0_g1_i1.p1 TRINITY_DN43429_c0_g1~~TRINITY_DN43429_c0_g1_i1.p1  ORF type:complete len:872 (-),score=93.82 TRINITY_DN43429_c0_g1_i1:82-2667(-)
MVQSLRRVPRHILVSAREHHVCHRTLVSINKHKWASCVRTRALLSAVSPCTRSFVLEGSSEPLGNSSIVPLHGAEQQTVSRCYARSRIERGRAALLARLLNQPQLPAFGSDDGIVVKAVSPVSPQPSRFQLEEVAERLKRRGLLRGASFRALIRNLGGSGAWERALAIFHAAADEISVDERYDVLHESRGAVIGALAQNSEWQCGLWLLRSGCIVAENVAPTEKVAADPATASADVPAVSEVKLGDVRGAVMASTAGVESCVSNAINGCVRAGRWELGLSLFHEFCLTGCVSASVRVCNAALGACAGGSRWHLALDILHSIVPSHLVPTVVCFNAAATACMKGGKWQHCISLLDDMKVIRLRPDAHTLTTTVNSCAKGGDWPRAVLLLEQMRAFDMSPDLPSNSALLSAFRRGSAWPGGLALLAELRADPAMSLDKIILDVGAALCGSAGRWRLGLDLLDEIQARRMQPSVAAYCSVLAACDRREALASSQDDGLSPFAPAPCGGPSFAASAKAGQTAMSSSSATWATLDLEPLAPAGVREHLLRCVSRSATEMLFPCGSDHDRVEAGSQITSAAVATSLGTSAMVAVDVLHSHGRLDARLETAFRNAVYDPTCLSLLKLMHGGVSNNHAPAPAALSGDNSQISLRPPEWLSAGSPRERALLMSLAKQAGLGAYFTMEALGALGLSAGVASWLRGAQDAVHSSLRHQMTRHGPLSEEPKAQNLLAWISYSVAPRGVLPPEAPGTASFNRPVFLRSNGSVVSHGEHVWPLGERILAPVFSSHGRSKHAERRALLRLAQRIIDEAAGSSSATGTVRLYSVHTPCVSCLAVFAQFRHRFPNIHFSVAFATWAETRAAVLQAPLP